MKYDLADCLVLNTRMAARAVTRRYESQLRGHGIGAVQFSLLASIGANADRSITEIAEALAMDRTTASRNIDLLARKGMLAVEKAESANRSEIDLTPKGRAVVAEILPLWEKAQSELRDMFGEDEIENTLRVLRRLAQL